MLTGGVRLSEEQRLDWLRLIRSDNVGPRAILVTEASDVTSVLEPILGRGLDMPAQEPEGERAAPGAEPAADERSSIIGLLGPSPVAIDDLLRLSGSSPAVVRTVLLELEIAGRLERHGGTLDSLI